MPCSWPQPTTTQPSEHPRETEAAPGGSKCASFAALRAYCLATHDSGEPPEGSGCAIGRVRRAHGLSPLLLSHQNTLERPRWHPVRSRRASFGLKPSDCYSRLRRAARGLRPNWGRRKGGRATLAVLDYDRSACQSQTPHASKDGRGSRTNMKECACRLRGGSNGWGTASSTGLATYDAMAYSQSVSQAYLVFPEVHVTTCQRFKTVQTLRSMHSCVNTEQSTTTHARASQRRGTGGRACAACAVEAPRPPLTFVPHRHMYMLL